MKEKVNLYVFLFFLNICTLALNAQLSYLKDQYDGLIKIKTSQILPAENTLDSVKNIILFVPYCEYRFYSKRLLIDNIYDSSFACKLANVDSNTAAATGTYVEWPISRRWLGKYCDTVCYNKLGRYSDTTLISLQDTSLHFIKKELDHILYLGKNVGLDTNYVMSERLFNYLKKFNAQHFVFTNVLVYQIKSPGGNASQFANITFFVFNIHNKKLVYYDDRYDLSGSGSAIISDEYREYNFQQLKKIVRKYKHSYNFKKMKK